VIRKLNELLAKGINPTALATTLAEIEGLDQEEAFRRTFALQTHRVEPAGAIDLWPQGANPQEVR